MVAEVARREDICTSPVYKWRRETRRPPRAGASGFSPVIIETPPRPSPTLPPANGCDPGVIEVELKDVRVRISADAPSIVIAATLKALRS